MSAAVLVDHPIINDGGCSNLKIPVETTHTLSIQSSSTQETGDGADSDSTSLRVSDFGKDAFSTDSPGTSPSLSSLKVQKSLEENDYLRSAQIPQAISPPFQSQQDEFLQFMEPTPVFPPGYDTLPPGGCPKFQILDSCSKDELPTYSPAAYKIGVVCRKLEWLSPYEPSAARSWKTFVMELNSTQLNFYLIPSVLENSFLSAAVNYLNRENQPGPTPVATNDCYSSLVTTTQDRQFQQLCDEVQFFKHDNQTDVHDDEGYTSSTPSSSSRPSKTTRSKRLIRSYSLQHARIGLATDYTKKTNVLRLRLESEQFLLNFASVEDLIDWNLGLSIGRDVAMDLTDREAPRYRTVPRRRRTQVTGSTPYYHEAVVRRRAQSDTRFETGNGIRGRLSKLKTKLSNLSLSLVNHPGQKSVQQQQLQQVKQFRQAVKASMNETNASVGTVSSMSILREQNRHRTNSVVSFSLAGTEDEDENDEQFGPIVTHLSNTDQRDDEGEEDIENLSDLHRSDDEDELDVDIDEFPDRGRCRRNTGALVPLYLLSDHKWRPAKKEESAKRFSKNCLKCIKPLTFDESWVNKLLMKPAIVSSLSSAYLRSQFSTSGLISKDSSFISLLSSIAPGSSTDLLGLATSSGHRRKSSSLKDSIIHFSDTALSRVANHHLKEYLVGSHALVPKEL